MRVFGREIAAWLAVVAAVFQVVMSFGLDADGKVQGWATAGVVFVFAVYTAIRTSDGIIALVTGVLVALFALFTALGLDWTAEHQATIVGAVTLVLGFFVRSQVGAPVGPEVSPAGKLVA